MEAAALMAVAEVQVALMAALAVLAALMAEQVVPTEAQTRAMQARALTSQTSRSNKMNRAW